MQTAKSVKESYDAVVVGARCAGAATAMLLARQGLSVLLVDRDRHGTDTLSTLALMRAGVLQLHRWGLLDQIRAANTPAARSTSFFYGDEEITVPIKPRDGVDALYSPRRTVIDALLAEAAADAGADVLFGPRFTEIERASDGRVNGAVIQERDGTVRRVGAGIVIGADGRTSTVARLVEAPIYRQGTHACGVIYTFWPGLENAGNRWYYRPGVSAGAIPTNDGDTCLFTATPAARFQSETRHDMEAGHRRVVQECSKDLARELEDAPPPDKFRGFPGLPGWIRQSHGPGWALVGDAGYFKDPVTAHGISDALRDAELLARAIGRGSDQALAEYQSTRDELSEELFDITDAIASFDWDLEDLKPMHLKLSKAMNREVKALLELS
jgi:2-polyprenyl-6-methoxyphenol hydroxylase-like FAD-dependent oxidoreductase